MKLVLLGHGDEPASPEMYVLFGVRRANAVLRLLVQFGVSMSRISVERPKVEGGRVVVKASEPGTVQVRFEPRFFKKGKENHGP